MDQPVTRFYEFGPFLLDTEEQCLFQSDKVIPLTPKLFALVLEFVQNAGRTLSKDDLAKALSPDGIVTDAAVAKNVSRLKKVLRAGEESRRYIETFSGRGYRFIAATKASDTRTDNLPVAPRTEQLSRVARTGDRLGVSLFGHGLVVCLLYASLYVVALFVEVAYEYNRYAKKVWLVGAGVFAWVLMTSAAALWVDLLLTPKRRLDGIAASGSIFFVAAVLVFVGVREFLPAHPITQALFQTYTAQGAYLKEIVYFVILGGFFVIGPFHFVLTLMHEIRAGRHQLVLDTLTSNKFTLAPKARLYLGSLTLLIVLFAIRTSVDHVHLFDNLTPGPHMNLFIQLVYVRLILYFALALQCLIWFYRSLNELKSQCVDRRPSLDG